MIKVAVTTEMQYYNILCLLGRLLKVDFLDKYTVNAGWNKKRKKKMCH